MARHFRGRDVALRFIEYMDVGATNGWRMDEVLPSAEVVASPRRRVRARAAAGVGAGRDRRALALRRRRAARSARSRSVTKAFCRDCNRARLSTEGKLFLCLFASRGHDLRGLLRGGASDAQIAARDRPDLARRATTAIPSCAARRPGRGSRRAARRDALHRRVSDAVVIRPLATADLADYKRLRDDDARRASRRRSPPTPSSEAAKDPLDYLQRLGLDRHDGGHFVLGAWHDDAARRRDRLRARDAPQGAPHRPHHRHDGARRGAWPRRRRAAARGLHRRGAPCRPRDADALGDRPATRARSRLYERHRFVAYGNLRRALKVGTKYHDKLHMVLVALTGRPLARPAVRRRCAGSRAGARSRPRCRD